MEDVTTVVEESKATEQVVEETTQEKETLAQRIMKALRGEDTKSTEDATKPTEKNKEVNKPETPAATVKTYTAEDLVAEKAKWDAEKAEQERLAKLPAEQRKEEEEKGRDAKIQELESKILKQELEANAITSLDGEGYPVKLAKLLDYSSKEKMESSLKIAQDTFKMCLEEALKEKLKGTTPEGLGSASKSENKTRDQIASAIKGGF